jgi:Tol biopolymer transport system component
MNATRKFSIAVLQILLLIALVLGLAWAIRAFRGPDGATQVYPPPEPSASSITLQNSSPYPLPEQAASSTPLPESTAISGELPQNQDPYSMPMIASTFTPFPSPTLSPGASATQIPLIQPAKDASGTLLYLALEEYGAVGLDALQVDTSGAAKGQPARISENAVEGTIFPSPDCNLLAIIDSWGSGAILDTRTGKNFPLAEGINSEEFFNWFPDNRRVLVKVYGSALWLVDPILGPYQSSYTPLAVPGYGGITGAAASPDGKYVIYSHQDDFNSLSKVWLVDSNGRNAKQVAEFQGTVTQLTWSPDGQTIAFFEDGLLLMDANNFQTKKVTNFGSAFDYQLPPLWSPDSEKIAVVTSGAVPLNWNEKLDDKVHIEIIDVKSGEIKQVASSDLSGTIDPAWSPDGTRLAFVAKQSDDYKLWEANNDGSNLQQLVKGQYAIRFPCWHKP